MTYTLELRIDNLSQEDADAVFGILHALAEKWSGNATFGMYPTLTSEQERDIMATVLDLTSEPEAKNGEKES